MREIKKYNRHDIDVVEKVYDKILRERGITKVYDKTLDTTYFRKYNVDMEQRVKTW